jgi:glycosyltransferase involved in cell wall biosynthesis
MALRSLSGKPVALAPQSHVVLCKIKNEALRAPYYVSYYRKLGFDAFIFIDNGSTDGTHEFLLAQPDCHVFETSESFGASHGGLPWINHALDEYCDGRWVVVADADEILVWPGSEHETIQTLTRRFDALGWEALFTILLDMYSDKPFGSIGYRPGAPFIDYCPFFDGGPYGFKRAKTIPHRQLYGGVRARMFRAVNAKAHPPTVSKIPLIKWRKGQRFVLSTHALLSPVKLARMRGGLLHFKLFDDFLEKCQTESVVAEYFNRGREYRVLNRAIRQSRNRSFYDPRFAVRYAGTEHLVQIGLIDPEKIFT